MGATGREGLPLPSCRGDSEYSDDDFQVGKENAQEGGHNDCQCLGHDNSLAGGSVRTGELQHRLGITKKVLNDVRGTERQAGHE